MAACAFALGVVSPALEARAQEADATATERSGSFTWRLNVEWITAVRGLDPAETVLNPRNATFRLPQLLGVTELRPNLRLEPGARLQFVFRPRWRGTVGVSWIDGANRHESAEGEFDMTEAYVTWRMSDAAALTYGLQNFQWGPSELLSPSNHVFRQVAFFRDPLYYVWGRHIVRLNVSAGKQWSLVGLAEVGANREPAFRAGEHFEPAVVGKAEYTTRSGASYFGVTVGGRTHEPPWFGEYASVALVAGLSAYIDASHQEGSLAWYPVVERGLGSGGWGAGAAQVPRAAFAQDQLGSGRLLTFAVGGLRYAFVSGVDARAEYVYQDAGYSREQSALSSLAVASQATREAVDQWLRPGLEVLGQRLVNLSVRVPDLPPAKRVDLLGSYLVSLTDDSSVAFVTTSVEAGDRLVIFGSATWSRGAESAEFSRLVHASVVGGAVWSW